VVVAHFNLARVKELVGRHATLAKAAWDWGFGDWETALGAASHVGNRDIAELLLRLRRPGEAADVCRGLVPRAEETGLAREAARALAYLSEAERELDLARLGQVRQFLRRIERGENPVWSAA